MVALSEEFSIAVDVRPLDYLKQSQVEQDCVFSLFFAFERWKIFAIMRGSPQVEKAPEEEVVVNKTVANPFTSDYAFERYLKRGKHLLEKIDEFWWSATAKAAYAAQASANGQKLFLPHQSVSRFKPAQELLKKWCQLLYAAPMLKLERTGCHITLIQPNTKRPGRTFSNPFKPRGKYPYNDGLSFAAIVLLRHGHPPSEEHDEASHLCGHGRCVNVDHLRWETIGVNSMRNECHHYGKQCCCQPRCIAYDHTDADTIKWHLITERNNKKWKKQQKLK